MSGGHCETEAHTPLGAGISQTWHMKITATSTACGQELEAHFIPTQLCPPGLPYSLENP